MEEVILPKPTLFVGLLALLFLSVTVSVVEAALDKGVANDKRDSMSPSQLRNAGGFGPKGQTEGWLLNGLQPQMTPSPIPPTPTIEPNPPTPTVTILVEPTVVPMVPKTTVGVGTYLGEFRVSFYTCAEVPNCQPGWPNSTTVAADLSILPRGTCIVIDGVGQKIVDDTGGAVVGYILDVFLPQYPGESLGEVHQRALTQGVGYRAVSAC